jgi:hypothetical protein
MSELIAFQTTRTERLVVDGHSFFVRFTKRTDREDYALFASRIDGLEEKSAFYPAAVATELACAEGQALADRVGILLKTAVVAA